MTALLIVLGYLFLGGLIGTFVWNWMNYGYRHGRYEEDAKVEIFMVIMFWPLIAFCIVVFYPFYLVYKIVTRETPQERVKRVAKEKEARILDLEREAFRGFDK